MFLLSVTMKKKTIRIVTLVSVIVIIALLGALKAGLLTPAPEINEISAISGDRLFVSAQRVKFSRLVDKIIVSGTVLPNEEVTLTSEVSGKIVRIFFEEGGRVKKNDLLIKMNDDELQAQLQKVLSQKKLADNIEARQRDLFKKGIISQEEYDKVLTSAHSFQAELDLVNARIKKTEIRAPFDGAIGLRYVSEGTYLYPEMRIANLISITPVKVDFAVPEKYWNRVNDGNKIYFRVEGDPQHYEAEVYAIEPKIHPKTRTLQIRAVYPNAKCEILPGAFAQIELILREFENTIQIPTEALIPESGRQKVYVYREEKAMPVFVETGIRTAGSIQIVDGLQPGDILITTGMLQIRPGMPVELSDIR